MPRVLLIRPLCEGGEPEFSEPLGIERLAGYLRANGVEAELLDRRLYEVEWFAGVASRYAASFWSDVRSLHRKGEDPQVIGFSLMTRRDVPDARRVMSRLKAGFPDATFVAGGVFVTTAPDEAARLLPRSCVLVRGEGEAALLALVKRGEAAGSFLAPDAWAEPYRPYAERYARLGSAVSMQTSRGCPGACTFCATPQLPAELRRWQGRNAKLVVDEIEHVAAQLEAAGLPPIFNLVDDDAGPLARLEDIASELSRRGLRVAWACEMRMAALIGQPDLARRLKALHEAGLTRLFVGVESLNSSTLRAWHKPYDVGRLQEVLDAVRGAGIAVQCGYILWHGGQTLEEALCEVRRLYELGIYTHQVAVSRLIMFAGSELGLMSGPDGPFESLGAREEEFYREFVSRTRDLRERWMAKAMREPYVAARAYLDGGHTELAALRSDLAEVNEASYREFTALAARNPPLSTPRVGGTSNI